MALHSKLAVENRQAAGPVTSNGKHSKTVELQVCVAEKVMLQVLYRRRLHFTLQDFDTTFNP